MSIDLVEGAGEDVKGVLLLHQLRGNAVKESPRLLVVGRPVLCKVLLAHVTVMNLLLPGLDRIQHRGHANMVTRERE